MGWQVYDSFDAFVQAREGASSNVATGTPSVLVGGAAQDSPRPAAVWGLEDDGFYIYDVTGWEPHLMWNPLRSIEDAFQLRDRLRPIVFTLRYSPAENPELDWRAEVGDGFRCGATAAEAITRAAHATLKV